MKSKIIKIASTIAAIITFTIGLWQFIVWLQEKSQNKFEGEWKMTTEITSAQLNKYIGTKMDWSLHLIQIENKLSGTAEKISVNSIELDYKDRTALTLQGSISGKKFTINFTENGKLRTTNGVMIGEFVNDEFQGTYSSTASDSKGIVIGYKIK